MDRIDQDADLSNVVFAGGLQQRQIDQWVDDMQETGYLSEDDIEAFKQSLCEHVGLETSHQLPDGAEGGRYGTGAANRWIKRYRRALPDELSHLL